MGLGDGLRDGLPEGDAVGAALGRDGETLGLALGIADGLVDGLSLGDTDGLRVGAEGLCVGVAVGNHVGLALGLIEGDALGLGVGWPQTQPTQSYPAVIRSAHVYSPLFRNSSQFLPSSSRIGLHATVGERLGLCVGKLGDADGLPLGLVEGEAVGVELGDAEGLAVGAVEHASSSAEVAPSSPPLWPSGQKFLHLVLPASFWYWPEAQRRHGVAAVASWSNWPGTHSEHAMNTPKPDVGLCVGVEVGDPGGGVGEAPSSSRAHTQ